MTAHPPFAKLARLADAMLIAGATACLLVFCYFAYLYYWTGSRQFSSGLSHFVSVGGPILLAILLLTALTRAASTRVKVAMCFCSAGASLLAFELFLTIWQSLPAGRDRQLRHLLGVAAQAQGIEFDSRSKLEMVDHLRAKGLDAVPSMFPVGLLKRRAGTATSVISIGGTEILPLASVSNKLSVVCNEGLGYLTYTSDEHGFHNPPGLWDRRPIDIVALGDSYVQGWCVRSDANLVSVIRRRQSATLSLGIEGDGPLEMLGTLREYGPVLKPRTVLWFFFEGNDLGDLTLGHESVLLRSYLKSGFTQNLVHRQAEIDAALLSYMEEARHRSKVATTLQDTGNLITDPKWVRQSLLDVSKLSMLRSRLGLVGDGASSDTSVPVLSPDRARLMADVFDLLTTVLTEAKREVENWGGRLVFVYLPARTRYDPHQFHPNPYRAEVLARARRVDLPIVDIDEAFRRTEDPMGLFPLRAADHYNEAGHALVANVVLEYLSQ
jgi:hypothetical protein